MGGTVPIQAGDTLGIMAKELQIEVKAYPVALSWRLFRDKENPALSFGGAAYCFVDDKGHPVSRRSRMVCATMVTRPIIPPRARTAARRLGAIWQSFIQKMSAEVRHLSSLAKMKSRERRQHEAWGLGLIGCLPRRTADERELSSRPTEMEYIQHFGVGSATTAVRENLSQGGHAPYWTRTLAGEDEELTVRMMTLVSLTATGPRRENIEVE
ncbi:hypothetical protein B0H65DRAFT_283612 [Neurospora tetraspora]|uniref:Uncharacterized protein n=1 Tax=Neurospora tetraspora TaxID=94610 RepID=A0AAE0MPM4_9PEZI|nr:hypothetical protein B0H65DRAFT_283612 [Neurospora tetraspora]